MVHVEVTSKLPLNYFGPLRPKSYQWSKNQKQMMTMKSVVESCNGYGLSNDEVMRPGTEKKKRKKKKVDGEEEDG